MLDFGTSKSNSEVSKLIQIFIENYFFLENYVTSEEPFLSRLAKSSFFFVTHNHR